MLSTSIHQKASGRAHIALSVGFFVGVLVAALCRQPFSVLQNVHAIPSLPAGVEAPFSTGDGPGIPRLSRHGKGFDVERMWTVLFKSPTAYRAEMEARARNGGRSPFAGKTLLKSSYFYPSSRKILIPADFSDIQAALAYAYELKNFEQLDETLGLQSEMREGAISLTHFADRCMDLEAQAAYREVIVARELRKAGVWDAHTEWEVYCRPGSDERESLRRIRDAIEGAGVVPGTDKTARFYYMWLGAQQLRDAMPGALARKASAASAE